MSMPLFSKGIVDIPNACATIGLPLDAFDFDIMPKPGGHVKMDIAQCALCSPK